MSSIPPAWTAQRFSGGALCVPTHLAESAHVGWFAAGRPDAVPVGEGGRQAAWFVDGDHGPAVLRHYRRGGLRAKLGRESYLWLGESRVRAYAEVRMLDHLRRAGVRVPEPLGAAYWRSALSYRNAILVGRIPGAQALASRLDQADPGAVVRAIAAMHAAGVWHADLNAHNILVDHDRAWLIDFDRGLLPASPPSAPFKTPSKNTMSPPTPGWFASFCRHQGW